MIYEYQTKDGTTYEIDAKDESQLQSSIASLEGTTTTPAKQAGITLDQFINAGKQGAMDQLKSSALMSLGLPGAYSKFAVEHPAETAVAAPLAFGAVTAPVSTAVGVGTATLLDKIIKNTPVDSIRQFMANQKVNPMVDPTGSALSLIASKVSPETFSKMADAVPVGAGIMAGGAVSGLDKMIVPKAASLLDSVLNPSAETLKNKAQKLTTELLQPSKGELANSLARGRTMPAIEEATNAIKASKNYTELRTNIDSTIKNIMDERNSILVKNNAPIGDYTDNLQKFIASAEAQGQYTTTEIQQMKDVYLREKSFLAKNQLDRITGQARKEELQRMTDKLLQKTEHGDIIDRDPARNLALDQLRRGLRAAVEAGDQRVIDLNSRYGGLSEAKKLVAGQEALSNKAISENVLQKIMRVITRPGDIPGAVAQGALDRQNSLLSKTKKISDIMQRAQKGSL